MSLRNLSWTESATNKKLDIIRGKCRNNAPEMNAVYAKEDIAPGEFLMTWNGLIVEESAFHKNPDENGLLNFYDLSKYSIEFSRGKKDFVICGRLDYNGMPVLPQDEPPTLRCMAHFMNEPDPDHEAVWNGKYGSETEINITKKKRNVSNACLRIYEKRGNWGPCVFASKKISKGQEITWRYDANPSERQDSDIEYDRTHYTFDYENMKMHPESTYVSAYGTDCTGTNMIHFEGNMPKVDKYAPDMYVKPIGTDSDFNNMKLRSKIYWDTVIAQPPLVQRRQSSIRRRVTVKSSENDLEDWHRTFYGTDGLRTKRENAMRSLRACLNDKRGKNTEKKAMFKSMLANLIHELENSNFLTLSREHVSIGKTIVIHLWKFIMRMQSFFWDQLNTVGNMHAYRNESSIVNALTPDKVAKINDGEEAKDWDDLDEEYEDSRLYAQKFFSEMNRIRNALTDRKIVPERFQEDAKLAHSHKLVCNLFDHATIPQKVRSKLRENNKHFTEYTSCKTLHNCHKKGARLLRKASEQSNDAMSLIIDRLFSEFQDSMTRIRSHQSTNYAKKYKCG